jgi:SAM-dependent methyltransferase
MAGASIDSVWNQGNPYEHYVGRWSRPVAAQFLRWLALPPALRWLDVGCGTGALASAIVATAAPKEVFAVDPSEGFLSLARQRLRDEATLRLGSAAQIPLPDASVDIAVSGLVLNFVPDLADGLAEMKRVVKSGGTIAAYVWDYAEGMQLMREFWDAAVALRPEARALDEGLRFPLCKPPALRAALESAGLADVDVAPLTIETPFRDFDDYWSPFLGGQGPAPGYCAALPEDRRHALRNQLRAMLPEHPDGTIPLHARAWAACGFVPER